MTRSIDPYREVFVVVVLAIVLVGGFLVGCNSLAPMMSYQGRLTSAAGQPLDGAYSFSFRLFQAPTGGTAVYTETKDIVVADGLFDTSIGPSTVMEGMRPEWLAQPLWLDVTINGEVLEPRKQLLGAPYAFTLMPGAVISSTLTKALAGDTTDAILTVVNKAESDPLPVLRVEGLGGLEIAGWGISDGASHAGVIYSQRSSYHSDIRLASNDELYLDLDDDINSGSALRVRNGAKEEVCTITEAGNLHCMGSSSFDGTKSAIVSVEGQPRKMYALESPEVWFEDFGSGTLVNGAGQVTIEPLFAATDNLSDYHVFVTPLGDCQGLYVTHKTPTDFEVHELGGGTANFAFDYRLVAKRLGYESERLEPFEVEAEDEI